MTDTNEEPAAKLQEIETAIAALKKALSGPALEAALAPLLAERERIQLTGNGAIATNSGDAIGRQGVKANNVGGDIVTGTKDTGFDQREQDVEKQINIAGSLFAVLYQTYRSAPGKPALSEADVRKFTDDYLTWVSLAYGGARLYGAANTPVSGRGKPRRNLQEVFVPLSLAHFRPPEPNDLRKLAGRRSDEESMARAWVRLAAREGHQGERVSLDQLLPLSDRIAIVGGPGSGKSTLLAYLAVTLAEAAQHDPPYKLPFALPDSRSLPFPLLIPLRYYRDYLDRCESAPRESLIKPGTGTLARFIPWYLQRRNPTLGLSEDFFDRLLKGKGCLLLLDGLDEVVNREDRGMVREEVEYLFRAVYPGNRCIVTAREAGYVNDAIFSDDFTRLNVCPLGDEQIKTLVHNWSRQLYPGNADTQTKSTMASIREVNGLRARGDSPSLVDTPLMTTMVISVKWDKTKLPRERARLYEACVEVILQAQYVPTEGQDKAHKEVVEWGGPWEQQRDWLSHLALEMHRGGQDGSAVREERLRQMLGGCASEDHAAQFIRAVYDRGGLLEERGGFFQFLHLTFQEFLAARLLAKQRRDGWQQLQEHLSDPWWREVILLTYGFARMDYPPAAQDYLDWLLTLPGDVRLPSLELAGAALLELEQPDETQRRQLAERMAATLVDPELHAPGPLRGRAGDILAHLGDLRRGVGLREDGLPDIEWVQIPAGPFLMGSSNADKHAYSDEKPQHTQTIEKPYAISRYPVTNAQYAAFVEADGYAQKNYWTEAGWAQKEKEDWQDPERYRPPFDVGNHPVIGVSWYEAVAYCRWLTEELRKRKELSTEQEVRLPSEAEWEKAARGEDGRIYPWGARADPECANYRDTEIGTTSAVGCFEGGAGPYGVEDMSGNVLEWCGTKSESNYNDYRDDNRVEGSDVRVLRGGAFGYSPKFVRCACRDGSGPFFRYYNIGFRVVVSPSAPGSESLGRCLT